MSTMQPIPIAPTTGGQGLHIPRFSTGVALGVVLSVVTLVVVVVIALVVLRRRRKCDLSRNGIYEVPYDTYIG